MDWLYKLSYYFQLSLILIIYLHHDNADGLVFAIICHLGDVPVSREEDEELAGGTVEETGLPAVVIVVDYVGTILAVGGAGVVVDHAKTLGALNFDDYFEWNRIPEGWGPINEEEAIARIEAIEADIEQNGLIDEEDMIEHLKAKGLWLI
jgi:hypothetical protein